VTSSRRPDLVSAPSAAKALFRVDAVAATGRAVGCTACFAQAPAVIAGDPVDGVREVAEQVPAIGDLDRVRCPDAGALGVTAGAVSADDLRAGMSAQPVGEGVRKSIREQVHRLAGVHVDQHGAVGMAAPLTQAARACFGTPEWPAERPVPQASIEFEVADPALNNARLSRMPTE
jgi:hypothetical protein